jgi:hypothetical protein
MYILAWNCLSMDYGGGYRRIHQGCNYLYASLVILDVPSLVILDVPVT